MTTHLTKIWWDLNKHKLVEQAIPEAEIYKRKWVGLSAKECAEIAEEIYGSAHTDDERFYRAIEAKLKEKNA